MDQSWDFPIVLISSDNIPTTFRQMTLKCWLNGNVCNMWWHCYFWAIDGHRSSGNHPPAIVVDPYWIVNQQNKRPTHERSTNRLANGAWETSIWYRLVSPSNCGNIIWMRWLVSSQCNAELLSAQSELFSHGLPNVVVNNWTCTICLFFNRVMWLWMKTLCP